jgi:uncharacterized Zn-binding protein involved in type VI secretion
MPPRINRQLATPAMAWRPTGARRASRDSQRLSAGGIASKIGRVARGACLGYSIQGSGGDKGMIKRIGLAALLAISWAISWAMSGAAHAQDRALDRGAPGVITEGSTDTLIGGQAAARRGDATSDPGVALEGGSPNVFINGRPAVTLGDRTGCGGVAVGGSSNVFINGKPVARAGDLTTGCSGK